MTVFTIFIIVVQIPAISCDIPLPYWLVVFFCLNLVQTCDKFIREKIDDAQCLQERRLVRKYLKILFVVSVELFYISWLIYGNALYYSKANNCTANYSLLSFLMLCILIMGYFHFLVYLIILGLVIAMYVIKCKNKRKDKRKQMMILKGL